MFLPEVRRQERGWSSLLWLCRAKWVTAVYTGGGHKRKAEQISGWLLVNSV